MADAFILQGRITADNRQAISALNETDNRVNETAKNVNKQEVSLAKSIGSFASKVGTAMLGVSTAIGTLATKSFVEFETTVAKVSTLVSDEMTPQLKKDMIALSKELGIDANQVGEAMYQGLSSGVSEENITDFTNKMSKLAKGGFTEVATATDLTTTILNAYGLEMSETTNIMDKLIQVQNSGKTTVGELGSSMGKTIPSAKAYGINLDNVASAYALMTKQGVATAEAGTYMSAMFNELGKSGTKVSDIIKKQTGKSFSELMESGSDLSDILNILNGYAEKNKLSLGDLFGSAEAAKAGLILASEGGALFKKELEGVVNSTGEAEKAFQKMDNTLRSRIDKIIQRVKGSFIQLGEAMLPLIEGKILPAIEKFSNWLANLDEETLNNMASWVEWGVKIGGALLIGGKLLTWGSSMVTSFSGLTSVLTGTATATTTLGTGTSLLSGAIALLSNPITLAVAGVVALGVAIFNNEKKIQKGTEDFKAMGEGIDDFSGKLRTNESFWTQIFGKEYEFKMSAQFHEQRNGIEQDSNEIIGIVQNTHNTIEEILNSDISTEEKQQKLKEAHEQEIQQLTEKWTQYNSVDNKNQIKNGQAYMQYLTELGVTDYNFRSEQLGLYNEYFDSQQASITANEEQILAIKQSAYMQNRQLTADEETQINDLIKTNADIRTNLVDMEGSDVWAVLDKWNLEKKVLYGEDAQNHNVADLEKRKSMQDYLADKKSKIDEEIKKINQRSDIDNKSKDTMINNLKQQKQEYNMFETEFLNVVDGLMRGGMSYEQAVSGALTTVNNNLDSSGNYARGYGKTNAEVWAGIISNFAEGGASAEELTNAINQIPADTRPQVIAKIEGQSAVENLVNAIARVKDKVVSVKAYTQGTQSVYQMSQFKGSEGIPKRAMGDEGFAGTRSVLVGEQGAEIVQLPYNSKVKTHRETKNTVGEDRQPPLVAVQIDGRTIATVLSKYISEGLGQRNRQLGFGGAY